MRFGERTFAESGLASFKLKGGMAQTVELDRLAMRARPPGLPVMHQNWENLLFLHWPVAAEELRPLVPAELELDLFADRAWIGVTPFQMTGVRLHALPEIPGLNTFLELNVRTYVHHHGKPGIYFFSLDASKILPTVAARLFYFLPYFRAEMEFTETAGEFRFHSKRLNSRAAFQAAWRVGDRLPDPSLDSLAFFLVERYALFVEISSRIHAVRIYHHPWVLEEAIVSSWDSTMISALDLPQPEDEPLAHFSRFLNVEAWEPMPAGRE